VDYITPEQFARYKEAALEMGFLHVASGPLVRSSYHADEFSPAGSTTTQP
jgi:lipoic acid synthetase